MLARPYRLHQRRDLKRAWAARPVFSGSAGLTLRVVRRTNGGTTRTAVVVGRRVSKRAVDRNRVARRIREAMRRELPHLTQGVDLLVAATAPASTYTWAQVVEELHTLLQRAKLLHEEW